METIAAIATPHAAGGISVIRISGDQAFAVADRIFHSDFGKIPSKMAGYTCAYGTLANLDDGILTAFRAPHSYTGEDVVELSCHGGIYLTQQILDAVLHAGAVPAQPGEFTKRAFCNGKLSLTQAEAVMDVIAASGSRELQFANAMREGAMVRRVHAVQEQLVTVLSGLAAWADYPEEDLPEVAPEALQTSLQQIQQDLKQLLQTKDYGRILKSGVLTVIAGKPNVGKSTFLSRVTNAQPKIANYHFTTLSPNLGVVDTENGGFVIADIPGLIEGASEGVGLGHEFLRHIERTRVIIHIVDAASTEGRDPIDDIYKINKELEAYNPEIAKRPQVIAANKIDCFYGEDREKVLQAIKDEFEPEGISVFPISAVSGEGVQALLYHVKDMLDHVKEEQVVFEKEYMIKEPDFSNEPYTVEKSEEEEGLYIVEGPRIERMLGYTNLDSEKGFEFFQKFLKTNGILDELEKLGIEEGDTVKMYGWQFEFMR